MLNPPITASFEPASGAHAIAEMVVFFEFTPDLSAAFPALFGWESAFPNRFVKETPPAYQLHVEMKEIPTSTFRQMQSAIYRQLSPKGELEWLVNVQPAAISVHCLAYSHWKTVWPEIATLLNVLFKHLEGVPVSVSTIGMKYVDRFNYIGEPVNYSARLLFEDNAPYLNANIFKADTRWHNHTGWFDKSTEKDGVEVLNQLNIDALSAPVDGKDTNVVVIDHTQLVRAIEAQPLTKFIGPTKAGAPLDELMNRLHAHNGKVLSELLTPGMAKRINLPKPAKSK